MPSGAYLRVASTNQATVGVRLAGCHANKRPFIYDGSWPGAPADEFDATLLTFKTMS